MSVNGLVHVEGDVSHAVHTAFPPKFTSEENRLPVYCAMVLHCNNHLAQAILKGGGGGN